VPLCNCIPCFVASDPAWEARFVDAGLPLIGDDMRSQFGASALSAMLEELALARGCTIHVHIQQNSGGNTDVWHATSLKQNPQLRPPHPPPPPPPYTHTHTHTQTHTHTHTRALTHRASF
jgi:hypothetical protein